MLTNDFLHIEGKNVMNKERNLAIYKMRQDGSTYKDIAATFEISVERARQICIFLKNMDLTEIESELYQFIVDDSSQNFTISLYNTLRRSGIDNITSLQDKITDINEHPENYIYIGDKGRSYLNQKLDELAKNA